jgi:DNA-binding transcriptional ArsR family regulator
MDVMPKEMLELIADRFKLLGCSTRLQLLNLVCDVERTVGELVRLTGQKQANVSKQMGLLSRAGLVERRVDGNHVYYSVEDETLPKLCEIIRASLQSQLEDIRAHLGG